MIYRKNSASGTINNPGVGDVRITYKVITNTDKGILFGQVKDQTFRPFTTNKDKTFYRFLTGVDSQTSAVNDLQAEYKAMLWLYRFIGFFMMFLGLLLVGNPVMTLLSVIPIFAKIGRFMYAVVAFFISLLLTALTIVIGMILHNIYLAAAVVLLIILLVIFILRRKKKKSQKKKSKEKVK